MTFEERIRTRFNIDPANLRSKTFDAPGVISASDAPGGSVHKLKFSSVREVAAALGVPDDQPRRLVTGPRAVTVPRRLRAARTVSRVPLTAHARTAIERRAEANSLTREDLHVLRDIGTQVIFGDSRLMNRRWFSLLDKVFVKDGEISVAVAAYDEVLIKSGVTVTIAPTVQAFSCRELKLEDGATLARPAGTQLTMTIGTIREV